MQSDGNSLKFDAFRKGYNLWTDGLILILKTPNRLYSCLA